MADGDIPVLAGDPPGISEAALKKAEEFIEADEGAFNRLSGTAGTVATTVATDQNAPVASAVSFRKSLLSFCPKSLSSACGMDLFFRRIVDISVVPRLDKIDLQRWFRPPNQ